MAHGRTLPNMPDHRKGKLIEAMVPCQVQFDIPEDARNPVDWCLGPEVSNCPDLPKALDEGRFLKSS